MSSGKSQETFNSFFLNFGTSFTSVQMITFQYSMNSSFEDLELPEDFFESQSTESTCDSTNTSASVENPSTISTTIVGSHATRLRFRTWCGTLNNPTETEEELFRELVSNAVSDLRSSLELRYMVYQKECGENSNQIHLQFYLESKKALTLQALKRTPCFRRAHLEKRMGTALQASNYCKKEESRLDGPWEWGVLSQETQGKRSDLEEIKGKICSGVRDESLWTEHFGTMVRYYRGINCFRSLITPKRNWKTEVYVLWGVPGTGKSRYCLENYPGAYWKQRGQWWDNYCGEDAVILDDFYGWLPYDTLLRICDRYPLLVESKGGNINFTARYILITSNQLPEKWYPNMKDLSALERRVEKWFLFNGLGYEIKDNKNDLFP